jgi:glycosyltransferase involved in cell wall biosynthesis
MEQVAQERWARLPPEAQLRGLLRENGVVEVRSWLESSYSRDPVQYEQLAHAFVLWLWRLDQREAVAEASRLDTLSPAHWPSGFRGAIRLERLRRLVWLGEYTEASALLQTLPDTVRIRANDLATRVLEYIELADAEDALELIQPPSRQPKRCSASVARILYFAHHSLPYHNNGYAHRTASLVAALKRRGWNMTVGTRLGFPVDREVPGKPLRDNLATRQIIEGVDYVFSPSVQQNLNRLPPLSYLRVAAVSLANLIERDGISLVHAASNSVCGLVAVAAARACDIPVVYEARGAWEVTRASRDPNFERSDAYRLDLRLERAAASGADCFLAINGPVGERYAVDPTTRCTRLFQIVPNGIERDTVMQARCNREQARASFFLPEEALVLGYAGSIVDYEGLDLLVQAMRQVRDDRCDDVRLLAVGEGVARPLVENMARHLGMADRVSFVGRVDKSRLPEHYAAMDVVCIPRRAWPVCELVTPLKPFEAMAAGLPLIVSSVAPLEEAVRAMGGGIIFEKGDVADLANAIAYALDNRGRLKTIGAKCREEVIKHRSWDAVVEPVDHAYRELLW